VVVFTTLATLEQRRYSFLRQNSSRQPRESCLRPVELTLALAPRRPTLTRMPRFER
jgi:hypothetical protein